MMFRLGIKLQFHSMRAHVVIIGAGISGLTAAITIAEGVDALIAAGRAIARPQIKDP